MKILALDTATENCSAALVLDADRRFREIEMERGHAERILPMIDELLAEAGIGLSELDAIAFGRGPGSFTGVRLAATVTQGLAFGAGLGVIPISDLQAVAQRAFRIHQKPTRILVCNDARMSEVYWACFERGHDGLARRVGEEHVGKPSDVRLPSGWSTAEAAGRGFAAYAEALLGAVPTVTYGTDLLAATGANQLESQESQRTECSVPLTQLLPHALDIALLAVPQVAAGGLLPPEAATPVYLRDNVAHVAQAPKRPT